MEERDGSTIVAFAVDFVIFIVGKKDELQNRRNED